MRVFVTILVLTIAQLQYGNAQTNKIEISAKYDSASNSILLRWAHNNSSLWRLSNKYGVTLERYVYEVDNQLIPLPLVKDILLSDYKPKPLEDWEAIVQENDYAAIAAQCLYGESFNFTDANSSIMSIVNKSKEQENKYSFTLFSADQSFKVAQLSGLGFIDNEIKKNVRYLYRIYPNIPDSVMSTDTSFVYYGANDFAALPKIRMSYSIQEEGNVQVLWNKLPYGNEFVSFDLERKNGENEFVKLNNKPIINLMENGPSKSNRYGSFVDTTAIEGTSYYRVIGKDAFGFYSQPSDTLKIQVKPQYKFPFPSIDTTTISSNGGIEVKWSATGDNQYIRKVFLERAKKADGKYTLINSTEETKYALEDKNPEQTNYYRIGVLVFDQLQYSFPHLHNVIDSVPPAIPHFVESEVNDSIVTLMWNRVIDKDVAGYRIFKSNFQGQEPSIVNDTQSTDTTYSLYENLRFINTERYYYLASYDINGNTSKLSEAFQVTLPDIVPPTAPVFEKIEQKSDTIVIKWKKSASNDVAKYLIYRRLLPEKSYKLVGIVPLSEHTSFDFLDPERKTSLLYKIIAVDSSGNEAISDTYRFNYTERKNFKKNNYVIIPTENGIEIKWEVLKSHDLNEINVYQKLNEQLNLIQTAPYPRGKVIIKDKKIDAESLKIIFI